MKKIFITGSNGLLGRKLIEVLDSSYNLIGCDLNSEPTDVGHSYLSLDLTDRRGTIDTIRDIGPDLIIHTAAMTNVDRCELEKEKCWRNNVTATENIVLGADKVNAKVVFLSTDYVFDGREGPYSEDDRPDPISYYGRSKLAAENLLRGSRLDWAIIRTIVLYGHGSNNFLPWLVGELKAERPVRIVNDQWSNMTFVDDLAVGIDKVISRDFTGILNISGDEFMDRYQFACMIALSFGLDTDLITSVTTSQLHQSAPRPLKSGLKIDKAKHELGFYPHTIDESLLTYKRQTRLINSTIDH
ncbi:MAG: SDR family oxidoreductase [Candidatus Electryoneaceae bacterium]|nr:SDR family oxidoreductase [Candidatus Electryoneaceae bacterium]